MSDAAFLHARDVVKHYGDRRVLNGVTVSAPAGRRVGVVGENGVGKSTLLRVLAGVEEEDTGTVRRPADCGFLHQELPFPPEAAVQDVVDDALADIRRVQHRMDVLTGRMREAPADTALLTEYGDLVEWAQEHDLWDADRRARRVLEGLGLAAATADARRGLGTLSGGERSRLALAALLIRQPRALVLDEPTNHLDDAAIGFLERHLRGLPGAVLLASHDRMFLDEVCTDILDLDPSRNGATRYGGSYSDHLVEKHRERVRWKQQYRAEQDEIAQQRRALAVTARDVSHNREMRDKNKMAHGRRGDRVQQQVSRRVRDAERRLAELTGNQVRKPPVPLAFAGTLTSAPVCDLPLALRGVRLTGRLRVDELDLPASGRIMVTGPNGAGKSTLLHVLAGRLAPDAGAVHRGRGVRVGMLEQEVAFADERRTPRQLYDGGAGAHGTSLCDLGLLAPRDLDRCVGELSTGQRRRLALARLLAAPPHVLLLDEPTNHLSLSLVEELEDALGAAPGAIVIASHDRWLRWRWNHRVLHVTGGGLAG
ncbi:ABC-F family ATP-binding cassette domain-containing protein [Bounagaea algeriensis]